jgi:phosphoglucomutase
MGTRSESILPVSAEAHIVAYLDDSKRLGLVDEQAYSRAKEKTITNLREWLGDERIPESVKEGVRNAISDGRWEDIVNTYRQAISFGTGGIRGMMAFDKGSILRLKTAGIDAPILKGPNTINDVVLLKTSAGVARYGKKQSPPFNKIVIGYDSRVRGQDFARTVAELFLAYDYSVYFFDEPCPYPEMTFAIPYLKADLGILISASHNDYRYNGYKLSCANGSQFDPEQRNEMYNEYISKATTDQIKRRSFHEGAKNNQLTFLGGEERVPDFDYLGLESKVVNIHREHSNHVKTFLMMKDLRERQRRAKTPLEIVYCAFHGAGRRAVPRLLREVGFNLPEANIITKNGLNDLDGMFPSFRNDPGHEQQPDPGDPRAAHIALEAFQAQGGQFGEKDILIGTDPDADRCGVVVKVPSSQRHIYGNRDWVLLPADAMWALLLWYRLSQEAESNHGRIPDAEKKFIVLSHTTSDCVTLLARKHGLGVIRTWVGFAALAAVVRDVWEGRELKRVAEGRWQDSEGKEHFHPFACDYMDMNSGQRSFNMAAMEQSNGFSILGGPPADSRSLGRGGHVRDKDGTLAALLTAEVAAWAKEQGKTLLELIDEHIYLDPDVGLFVNHYEPDPMDGEYPGIQGDQKKKLILRRVLGYYQLVLGGVNCEIGGHKVLSAAVYRTGKYDAIYTTYDYVFPDEGVRFYLDRDKRNHVTIRPSGTGNSLRFHIQLHTAVTESNLIQKKQELMVAARKIMDDLRKMLSAPRE